MINYGAPFSIKFQFIFFSSTQGAISVLNKLDREKNEEYTLILDARDCPDDLSEEKSSQTTIRIIVTDINDNAPLFDMPEYNLHVKEDASVNIIVSMITANDGDEPGSNNSLISYEISAGNQANLFKVDSHSGTIKVNSSLRGHVGNYSLTIIATDHGDPRLNGTTVVHLEVTDVNLNAPVVVMKPPDNKVKTYEVCSKVIVLASINFGPLSTCQRNAIRMAFLWQADIGPFFMCLLGQSVLYTQ